MTNLKRIDWVIVGIGVAVLYLCAHVVYAILENV
jgi:hypothetical protein